MKKFSVLVLAIAVVFCATASESLARNGKGGNFRGNNRVIVRNNFRGGFGGGFGFRSNNFFVQQQPFFVQQQPLFIQQQPMFMQSVPNFAVQSSVGFNSFNSLNSGFVVPSVGFAPVQPGFGLGFNFNFGRNRFFR